MTDFPTLAEIKAAKDSPNAVCCFCGDSVPKEEAIIVTLTRIGTESRQRLWAHVKHVEDAIAPSGLKLEPEDLRSGPRPG